MRVPIQRILCPVDFSEYSVAAYRYAVSLAQRYKATLFALNVVETWKYPSACFAVTAQEYESFCDSRKTEASERLRQFVSEHSTDGFRPELVVQEGMAVDRILSCAQQELINLIVIGTHGVHGFDRVVVGSVTEKVLRKAHCSVLAVHKLFPEWVEKNKEAIQLDEILYCTDFSDYSNRAFDYALSVAKEYNAHLTLVHVIDGITRSQTSCEAEQADDQLVRLATRASENDFGIMRIVRTGRAYKEISDLATERHADLVVMAVHGRNAIDSAIFGSTTYRVVRLGETPVLAVHC
jgi:nucleotide-binding universal stress UspA family protein